MKDGWGLATDGKVLYGSDGSSTLYHIDPYTFKGIPLSLSLSLTHTHTQMPFLGALYGNKTKCFQRQTSVDYELGTLPLDNG